MKQAIQSRASLGSAPASLGAAEAALPVFDRLLQALQSENDRISVGEPVDYRQFALRKSQGLLELSRLSPSLAGAAASPEVAASLTALIGALELNKKLLGVQVKAAQKVSDLIAKAIQDGQSDGTYSPLAFRYGAE